MYRGRIYREGVKMEFNNDLYTKASFYIRRALNNPSAEFREGQFECIEEIMRNKRVLAVQRTGYGKSMIYFLATRGKVRRCLFPRCFL